MTEFRMIDRLPGYRIGDDGSVWSSRGSQRGKNWRLLLQDNSGKYARVRLYTSKTDSKNYEVHRLVLEAFIGPCPKGLIGCHEDGNRANNALSNLQWGTHSKNNGEDKRRHGTSLTGERHHKAKLTDKDVLEIRKAHKKGKSCASLAREYNRGESTIRHVLTGKTWSHLPV